MSDFAESFVQRMVIMSRLPEFNVLLFAFLLNYPWEFIQAPLFEGMAGARHWDAVKTCTRATLGDAVIMLIAYWAVAVFGQRRYWIAAPTRAELLLMIAVGAGITAAIETLVLHGQWLTDWSYSTAMPVVPGWGVGLVPLLQWILLPPIAIALVRRQLQYDRARAGSQCRRS